MQQVLRASRAAKSRRKEPLSGPHLASRRVDAKARVGNHAQGALADGGLPRPCEAEPHDVGAHPWGYIDVSIGGIQRKALDGSNAESHVESERSTAPYQTASIKWQPFPSGLQSGHAAEAAPADGLACTHVGICA